MPGKRTLRSIPQQRGRMPLQDATQRRHNFTEVALGLDLEAARHEAARCLLCASPDCVPACPVNINIPRFIEHISEGDVHGAYASLSEDTLLPAICGRVCPQENQCEGACVVGKSLEPVAIGRLERFVGDQAIAQGWHEQPRIVTNERRVAIVGSGPAGMACAADLAKAGCAVTLFEALHQPGGVLRYGIPEFRLPNAVLDGEYAHLQRLGVHIECNTLVGRLFTLQQMLTEMGFDAVFIGTGAGSPKFMNLAGESLNGVLSANELLTRCNLMQARDSQHATPLDEVRKVIVIGAGNTAMDALRVSLRLGAEEAHCVYRRSIEECPARQEEREHAEQEGVEFHWLSNPLEILDDGQGRVSGVRCQRMTLGEPDASGRRRPEPVPDSEFSLSADTVIYAIGTNPNPILGQTSALQLDPRGYIQVDDTLATSLSGVFAGGDIVTGAATVIQAMGAGRRAAASIRAYLRLRDSACVYPTQKPSESLFGIPASERNFVRLHTEAPITPC